MTQMNIDSPHAGTLDGTTERIFEFPNGLPGFEEYKRFTVMSPESEKDVPSYFILQSVDEPGVAFNISDPALFGFHYEIALSTEECDLLKISDPGEAAVAVILVKEDNALRANLQAPLVLNLQALRGLQHIFSNLSYQVTLKSAEGA